MLKQTSAIDVRVALITELTSRHSLTDRHKLCQSVPAYKHAALDRLPGCPSTITVQTKHADMLFSKTPVKQLGAVQIQP